MSGTEGERGLGPIRLAVWVGLLTGFGEAALLAVQRYGMGRMLFLSGDFPWMAPMGEALCFLPVGGLLYLLRRTWPRQFGWQTTIAVLISLGAFAGLLMYPPLHRAGAALLAIGIGVQAARLLKARPTWFAPMVRWSTLAMTATIAVLAAAPRLLEKSREARIESTLPPAAPSAPNILFIMLDTVRAASLSLYGYGRETTPFLSGRGARGVVFNWAIAPAPWTLPSHASAFTGRWPHELKVDWRVGLDHTFPTLAEALTERGYRTAGFAANTTYCSEESGLSRGFTHWEAYPANLEMVIKSSSLGRTITGERAIRRLAHEYAPLAHRSADDINGELLRWLDAGRSDSSRPFMAFLNYYDAHAPYLPPEGFRGRFGPSHERKNISLVPGGPWSPEEVTAQQNAYEESIAFLDSKLGELFDSLEARGELSHTLIVVAGDHGEEFMEHGVMDHGNTLYLPSVHVPLLFWLPGRVPEGIRVDQPVSLRDVPATILDLAGLDPGSVAGRSLSRFWGLDALTVPGDTILAEVNYASGLPERYPISRGPMRSVLLQGYRYILNGDGGEELYRVAQDPGEQDNLMTSPAGRDLAPSLRAILDRATPSTGN